MADIDSPGTPDNKTAVWSLVLGLASVFCCFLLGIGAILLGLRARRQVSRGTADNANLATLAIVLGIVGLVGNAVAFGYYSGILG